MHFSLTDGEEMIRETARRIAAERLAPIAEKLDRGEGRDELLANLKLLAENGFMALNVKAAYGGTEAGSVAFALAVEEIGYACAATGVATSVTNMVGEVIQAVGSEEQRRAYLPRLADGTYAAGAFCLTESGAGSDPAGMTTRARRDGKAWVIDGEKLYISSAEFAGLFVVWAVTDASAPKGKGISVFLVERDAPGLVIGKAERKMGQAGSPTNVVGLDGCRVPAEALMGPENDGFRVAVGELAGGRIGVAALSLRHRPRRHGCGEGLCEGAPAVRSTDRRVSGHPVDDRRPRGRPRGGAAPDPAGSASQGPGAALRQGGLDGEALRLGGGAPRDRHGDPAPRRRRLYHGTTRSSATPATPRIAIEGTSEIQRLIIARETLRQGP